MLKKIVFLLMNTVGLSLPQHPSLLHSCSHADRQKKIIRSSLQVVSLLFFFFLKKRVFSQQVQQKAFKSQWPQRHLDVPEKGCWHKEVM